MLGMGSWVFLSRRKKKKEKGQVLAEGRASKVEKGQFQLQDLHTPTKSVFKTTHKRTKGLASVGRLGGARRSLGPAFRKRYT